MLDNPGKERARKCARAETCSRPATALIVARTSSRGASLLIKPQAPAFTNASMSSRTGNKSMTMIMCPDVSYGSGFGHAQTVSPCRLTSIRITLFLHSASDVATCSTSAAAFITLMSGCRLSKYFNAIKQKRIILNEQNVYCMHDSTSAQFHSPAGASQSKTCILSIFRLPEHRRPGTAL